VNSDGGVSRIYAWRPTGAQKGRRDAACAQLCLGLHACVSKPRRRAVQQGRQGYTGRSRRTPVHTVRPRQTKQSACVPPCVPGKQMDACLPGCMHRCVVQALHLLALAVSMVCTGTRVCHLSSHGTRARSS